MEGEGTGGFVSEAVCFNRFSCFFFFFLSCLVLPDLKRGGHLVCLVLF